MESNKWTTTKKKKFNTRRSRKRRLHPTSICFVNVAIVTTKITFFFLYGYTVLIPKWKKKTKKNKSRIYRVLYIEEVWKRAIKFFFKKKTLLKINLLFYVSSRQISSERRTIIYPWLRPLNLDFRQFSTLFFYFLVE